MTVRAFFDDEAKVRAAQEVKAIEARTAAEVVVAVHPASGHYGHTDCLVGFALSFVTLVAMLYLPQPFPLWSFPLEVVVAFLAGALLSRSLPAVRRGLTSPRLREGNVLRAARAAFVELGISRTTGRTGVLVFVSVLERRVAVVADIGVDAAALGPAWDAALAQLSAALLAPRPTESFFEAMRLLAPPLERVLPRSANDVNELPDAPVST